MDYWKLIKRAWQITGKYKFLWIFGLFSVGGSFISGSGGGSFNNNYMDEIGGNDSTINLLDKIQELFFENIILISIMTIVIMLISMFIFFIKIISCSSIVAGVNEIEERKESNFSKSFKLGLKYFWKILALQLLTGLSFFIILAILGLPVFMLFILEMPFRGFMLGLLAFVIFVPLTIVINYTTVYAFRSIIINNNKLFQAIKYGFEVFKNNILVTLFVSLILFAINMGVTIILMITLISLGLLFGIPIIAIVGIINLGAGLIGSILMVLFGILVVGLFMGFIGAILNTFQSPLLTLVFRELIMRRGSKCVEIQNFESLRMGP